MLRSLSLILITMAVFAKPLFAWYDFCEEIPDQVITWWPASSPLPAEPHHSFASQMVVRVLTSKTVLKDEARDIPLEKIQSGSRILSMTYVMADGQMMLIPCWDYVTHVSIRNVPQASNLQVTAVDVGKRQHRRRFFTISDENVFHLTPGAFPAEDPESKSPVASALAAHSLAWTQARHLTPSYQLVSWKDADRGHLIRTTVRNKSSTYVHDSYSGPASNLKLGEQPVERIVNITTQHTGTFFIRGFYPSHDSDAVCAYTLVKNGL